MTTTYNNLDSKILEILEWASNSEDTKLVLRWSSALSSIYGRELKYKNKNLELLRLIIKHCEYLCASLCSIEDEIILERMGPNILDALLKLRECIAMHEEFEAELEAEARANAEALKGAKAETLNLSQYQIESFKKLSLL